MGKKKGKANKTKAEKEYEKMASQQPSKKKAQQAPPGTSDLMAQMMSGLAGGDGDPKEMLNKLLSQMLGGGMMNEPEAPKIDTEALYAEIDELVTGIDGRIDEYARLSGSILTEDFSKLEDLVDFTDKQAPAKQEETEIYEESKPDSEDFPWDDEKERTMRELYGNYNKLCLIMETSNKDRLNLVETIGELPETSVCVGYQKTLTDAIDSKMARHKKLQRILRQQYLDTLEPTEVVKSAPAPVVKAQPAQGKKGKKSEQVQAEESEPKVQTMEE
jgi:hypothetical protein